MQLGIVVAQKLACEVGGRDPKRDDLAGICARRFAQLPVYFKPVAFLAVWLEHGSKGGKPLMVPSTVIMPRGGSLALAFFGRMRKVQWNGFWSFAWYHWLLLHCIAFCLELAS